MRRPYQYAGVRMAVRPLPNPSREGRGNNPTQALPPRSFDPDLSDLVRM